MNKFKQNISWKPEKKKTVVETKKALKLRFQQIKWKKKNDMSQSNGMLNMHVT